MPMVSSSTKTPHDEILFMCICACVYRGDRIQGVLYGQQQNLVATVWVVSVGRPGDPLGSGVIEVCLLA